MGVGGLSASVPAPLPMPLPSCHVGLSVTGLPYKEGLCRPRESGGIKVSGHFISCPLQDGEGGRNSFLCRGKLIMLCGFGQVSSPVRASGACL